MKILPDGTVEIKNKNTGATKIIQPADLPNYGIPYTKYASELEAAKSIGVPTTAEIIEKPAAADKKNELAGESVTNFIKGLEKTYEAAGGGTYGTGPGARIKGAVESLKGKMGLNEDASVYNDSKEGFAATLKSLTGDTGVLTDQDFARLSKLLPGFGSTKKEATDKFNQLRDQLSAKFGVEKSDTTFKPKVNNERGALASILDIPFNPAVSLAEKSTKDLSKQLETGNYKNIMDLLLPKTKEDVGLIQDVLPAGVATGATIAGGMDLLKGAKNAVGSVFGGKAKAIATREAAAQAVNKPVSTDPLLKAGKEYIKRDPTAAKLWNEVLEPALKSQPELSVPDLMKQIGVWNDAYTNAGKVGKTALAGLNDALARAGKDIIKEQAPEVAAETAKLAKLYGLEKTFGKFGPALVGGAGAGVGGYLGLKALGQQR
jgi:hypothetical protein